MKRIKQKSKLLNRQNGKSNIFWFFIHFEKMAIQIGDFSLLLLPAHSNGKMFWEICTNFFARNEKKNRSVFSSSFAVLVSGDDDDKG